MATLFVTGASGFIGGALLPALRSAGHHVLHLERHDPKDCADDGPARAIRGDLLEPSSYSSSLDGVDAVVHLAAVTGKAPERDYFRVNERGTAGLVEACARRGVRRFLFVSSIAVRFTNAPGYHYARSKERAEHIVRGSGIRYTILRPTIVLGTGSPIGRALRALSRLPLIPIVGHGRVRVQPIDVGDVSSLICAAVDEDRFEGEVLEAGGPDTLTMEELMQKLHLLQGGERARTVHLPLMPVRSTLGFIERISLALTPLTAGQIATFANDGIALPNAFVKSRTAAMKSVDVMLAAVVND